MVLLDFVYAVNRHLASGKTLLDKLQIKRGIGLLIKAFANYVLPVFLSKSDASLKNGEKVPIIVSITSFPARIDRVWMTIESIICQSCKPQAIILWLSRDQFPKEFRELPEKLVSQQRRGLTIRFVDGDIRSYKKFYYTFREYHDSLVLTIDDDLLIPSGFLKSIYECKLQHPNDVIASFGFRFKWDDSINYIVPDGSVIKSGDSGLDLFFGSGGGTLFDSHVASRMEPIEKIQQLCPTADDIYLNFLIRLCGYGVTFHCNNPLLPVYSRKDVRLVSLNGDIGDPNSVNACQFRRLLAHMEEMHYKNPFIP